MEKFDLLLVTFGPPNELGVPTTHTEVFKCDVDLEGSLKLNEVIKGIVMSKMGGAWPKGWLMSVGRVQLGDVSDVTEAFELHEAPSDLNK